MRFSGKNIFLSALLFLAGIAAPAERMPDTGDAYAIEACQPGKTFEAYQEASEVGQTFGLLKHAFHEAVFVEESEVSNHEPDFQGKEQKYGFLYIPPGFLSPGFSSGKIGSPFKGENYLPHQFSRRYILFRSLLI